MFSNDFFIIIDTMPFGLKIILTGVPFEKNCRTIINNFWQRAVFHYDVCIAFVNANTGLVSLYLNRTTYKHSIIEFEGISYKILHVRLAEVTITEKST